MLPAEDAMAGAGLPFPGMAGAAPPDAIVLSAPPPERVAEPPLPADIAFLAEAGVNREALVAAASAARADGRPAALHLFKAGAVDATTYYRAFAESLSLVFMDGEALPVDRATARFLALAEPGKVDLIRLPASVLGGRVAVAPGLDRIVETAEHIAESPDLVHRIVIATPATLRATTRAARDAVRAEAVADPALLLRLVAMAPERADEVAEAAWQTGADPLALAVRRGWLDEARLAAVVARLFAVPLVADAGDGLTVLEDPELGDVCSVRLGEREALAVMPTGAGLTVLAGQPAAASATVVAPRAVLRTRWRHGNRLPDLQDALTRLAPVFSAAGLAAGSRRLAASLAVLVLAGIAAALAPPVEALAQGAIVILLLFLAAIRVAILQGLDRPADPAPARLAAGDLPGYAVLVPLYHEADGVDALVAALAGLDYPAEKLDIKLIVEADDRQTRAALAALGLRPPFDVIVVPAAAPRTKPKALAFALPYAAGELVTIFDAEDRPEPDQLRRVAERFAAAPSDLGCIQARLAVDHADDTWFTRHFAVEYATLFGAVLPWLARHGIVFSLGGTSNHIRRSALETAGDWDPYNVTEDADLGIRLARRGWRLETIASTTWEEAPLGLAGWLPQRTRWHKGWLQTWAVHMRRPARLYRDLGRKGFAAFQLLIGGGLLVLALHLAFVVSLVAAGIGYALGMPPAVPTGFAGGAFSAVLVIGYGAAILLARAAARRQGVRASAFLLATMPLYWLLMGVALLSAVREILRRPGHWAKTTHGLATRPDRSTNGD